MLKRTGTALLSAVLCLAAFGVGRADLSDGLVAYYPFDGTANDASGFARHGTVFGAAPATDRFGTPNEAFSFDGADDFIEASADGLPTGERTVALWFFADSVSSSPVLVGYGGGACGTSWFMGLNLGGLGSYTLSSHCNVNELSYAYPAPPTGAWTHWAVVTDASGTRMYVDGAEVATNTNPVTNTTVTGTDLSIAVAPGPGGDAPYTDGNVGYFAGMIDDVRVYDRALSPAEILTLADGSVVTLSAGKKLLIKTSPAEPAKNTVVYLSKDPTLIGPLSIGQDPRCAPDGSGSLSAGGSLRVAGLGGDFTIELPCTNWSRNTAGTRYKYKDPSGTTCKVVLIKDGKRAKAVCKGTQVLYTLGAMQGDVDVVLTTGAPDTQLVHCARFGPGTGATVVKDGSDGVTYKALDAGAPAACGP